MSAAKKSRLHAHAPYSRAKVGAAVLGDNGKIYGGCNVENASFGATICAERTAILKAISDGARRIRAILVFTNANPPWFPCGMCRQTFIELSGPTTPVWVSNGRQLHSTTVGELVPNAFSPTQMSIS